MFVPLTFPDAPATVDSEQAELLILTRIGRKNLEMGSIAVRAVGQIQRLSNAGGNLHLAVAKIVYFPKLSVGIGRPGQNYRHRLANGGLFDIQSHPVLRGLDADEAEARILDVPLLVSGVVRWIRQVAPIRSVPLANGTAVSQVGIQNLAAGNILNLVSPRTRIAAGCLGP